MSPSMTLIDNGCFVFSGWGFLSSSARSRSSEPLRGRWHRYDCMQGGAVSSADEFDATRMARFLGPPSGFLEGSMCVATPAVYELPAAHLGGQAQQHQHHSPSGGVHPRAGRHDSGPTSPSGPRQSIRMTARLNITCGTGRHS